MDPSRMTNIVAIPNVEKDNCHLSPDCSGNPFLKKKIVMKSGK
jgi:hypothetical protein